MTGVPFFVVDRRIAVSGAQPADVFTQLLETAGATRTRSRRWRPRPRRGGLRRRLLRHLTPASGVADVATCAALADLNDAAVPAVNALGLDGLHRARPGVRRSRSSPRSTARPLGFVLALAPGADYASEHYRWFSTHVPGSRTSTGSWSTPDAHGRGVGRALYAAVDDRAPRAGRVPVADPGRVPVRLRRRRRADPLLKMHTLGKDFVPPPIHAGGLRYHGMAPMVSHAVELGLIDAIAVDQETAFAAGIEFAGPRASSRPESTHAVAGAIAHARAATEAETIVIGLSGNGVLDLPAYHDYV